MTAPLVSVLMPTWNGEAFVAETIESVLAQTYRPLELVAVDDGSTDATPRIVERYARAHPETVRLLRCPDRAGPCRRRNDALAAARGSLLAWLDHDDVWLPVKLERQVEILEARPDVALVYCDYEDVDSTGAALPPAGPHRLMRGDLLRPLFVEGCFLCSSTVVWRREAMAGRNLRFRDREFSFGDDYFLWLALSLDRAADYVDEILVRYRRHDRNESRRHPEENFHLRRVALLHEFLDTFPDASGRLAGSRRAGFARHYVRAARFEAGRRSPLGAVTSLARAARWHPGVVVERVLNEATSRRPVGLRQR